MTTKRSAEELFAAAVSVGSIQRQTRAGLEAVRVTANADLGVKATQLKSSRVFLVNVVVDDSGSISEFELVDPLLESIGILKAELQQAVDEGDQSECEVLITIVRLNAGTVQPYARVEDCVDLDHSNYQSNGGTPLFTRTFGLLGALTRKVAELQAAGRTAQTFTCVVSDGKPTDHEGVPGETARTAREVAEIAATLTETKQHILCGVDIGGAASKAYRSMGIPEKWIINPSKDRFAFLEAMRQVSRASRSASKSAGAFRKAADGGIGGFN